MFLTAEELQELTDRSHKRKQIEWLKARGWPFEIGSLGYPKVLRSVASERMGGKIEDNEPSLKLTDEAA